MHPYMIFLICLKNEGEQKVKPKVTIWASNSTPRHVPKRDENENTEFVQECSSSIICNSPKVEKTQCLSVGKWVNVKGHHHAMEFFLTFFNIYFREWGRGAEREGDTEFEADSKLWAVSTEPNAGLELANLGIMNWAKVGHLTNWATQVPHGILSSNKKKWSTDICHNLEEPENVMLSERSQS